MKPALKKWMPAAAIPAVIAATGVGLGISASATPQLEPKTAEQVIELMAGSEVTAFSGRIHLSTDLGIPALPDAGAPASFGPPQDVQSAGPGDGPSTGGPGAGARTSAADAGIAGLLNLVSGSHDARVYVDGPDKARVQLLEGMGEKDVIRNGTSLWTYDSEANEAVHTTLPEPGSASASKFREHRGGHATGEAPTPGQLADTFLAAAEPTTTTTVEDGSTVAGRDVYNLVLTPKKSQTTLIEDVTIGVDAASGVPLAVSVDAVGQDAAAVDLAFTSFTPKAPDAKLFDFTPPADATVHEKNLQQDSNWPKHTYGQKLQRPMPSKDDAAHQRPAGPPDDWFTGTGWDTVATIPAEQVPAELKTSALVGQLATDVDGGKLLHTSLVNVLISDDGRVLVGAVPLQRLQAVADGS
ncbi:outer membrane lipoprotein carrier protein LolA [Micrococcaceae bacterium RIT802]|nr:outer membrane lipoprotein carrier protein LolA [Micrococcaceae bacterium RIT 802]